MTLAVKRVGPDARRSPHQAGAVSGSSFLVVNKMPNNNSPTEPDQDQTVAALGHFWVILKKLDAFLHDPRISDEQRRWAAQQYVLTVAAQHAVLDHHAAAYGVPEDVVAATSSKAHPDATKH